MLREMVSPRKSAEDESPAPTRLAMLDAALGALEEGVLVQRASGEVVLANVAAERILGVTASDLAAAPTARPATREVLHADGRPWRSEDYPFRIALETGEPQEALMMVRTPERDTRWLTVTSTPITFDDSPPLALSTFTDVTEQQVVMARFAEAEARYRMLSESSTDILAVCAPDGDLKYISGAVTDVLGYHTDELVPDLLAITAHSDDVAAVVEAFTTAHMELVAVPATFRAKHRDGRWRTLQASFRGVPVSGQVEVHVTCRDVTDAQALSQIALTDPVTGLANRYALTDTVNEQLRVGRPTLLLLDLDYFKNVNDTYGHHVGDQLLQEVAHRVREAVRVSDTVARFGGDEFAVVLADSDGHGTTLTAERLLESFIKPYEIDSYAISCSASVGSAQARIGDTFTQLYERADHALYRAKRGGRNQWCAA